MRVLPIALVAVALVVTACADGVDGLAGLDEVEGSPTTTEPSEPASLDSSQPATSPPSTLPTGTERSFGPPPEVPTGPLDPGTAEAVEVAFGQRLMAGVIDDDRVAAIDAIGASGDPRTAWWLVDLLRVTANIDLADAIGRAYTELTGVEIHPRQPSWGRPPTTCWPGTCRPRPTTCATSATSS